MSFYNYKKVIVIFLFFCFSFINLVFAVDFPFLNKSKIRLVIPAGQTKYGEITVENPTIETRTMRVYLEDWRYAAGGDGAKEFLPSGTSALSCTPWINFSPAEFSIPPFGKQRVNYSIKVPAGAQGGYYAVLFFETGVGKPQAQVEGVGAGINLAVRIAALFYVEVEGTVKKRAEFENLSLRKDKKALVLTLDFHNTGNVDITAGGSFHIMDKEGLIYARQEFDNAYTFSGDTAKLIATWKEPIPKGSYDLVLTLDLGKAQEEAGTGRGPIVVKEAKIVVGDNGEIISVGELK